VELGHERSLLAKQATKAEQSGPSGPPSAALMKNRAAYRRVY
jgi:hypothetical protein